MAITASWVEKETRLVECGGLSDLFGEAAAADVDPVVVLLEAEGAELHVVAGDSTGTVLLYYPPGYDGVRSLHSVGDAEAASKDKWEPPLTAFYFGHHTEFPRWSVVAHELGARAAQQFCERPGEAPTAVTWEAD